MPSPEFLNPLGGCYITYVDPSGALRVIAFDATLRVVHTGTSDVTDHPVDTGATLTDYVRANPRRVTIEAEVTNTPILVPDGVEGAVSALTLSRGFKDLRKGANAQVAGGTELGSVVPTGALNLARVGARRAGLSVPGGIALPPILSTLQLSRVKVDIKPAEYESGALPLTAQTLQFPTAFDRLQDVWQDLQALRLGAVEVSIVTRLDVYSRCVIASVTAPEVAADAITFQIEAREINTANAENVTVNNPPVAELRARKTEAAGASGGGYTIEPAKVSAFRAVLDGLSAPTNSTPVAE